MQRNMARIIKNCKPLLVVLCVALIGAASIYTGASTLTAPAPKTELESSAEAKRLLAPIDSQTFVRIKDARRRAALQRSYTALKAIANNTSKAREAALLASFDQSITALKALPPPRSASFKACDDSYTRCIELCKETGANCDLCRLGNEGCYMIAWWNSIVNENNPTKH